MNRTGLGVALAVAAAAGLVLGIFPQLDIAAQRPFFGAEGFALRYDPLLRVLREASTWLIALLAAPACLAPFAKLLWPRRPMPVRGRAAVFLVVTLLLGPAFVTNVVLKDYWGRPRPIDIVEFGGARDFRPWWDPRGSCPGNCSFVAGEASGAFWTLAPAALAPPQWRPLAYAGALAFGSVVGLMRMSFGGHFLSDVVFAGVFTFLVIWLVYGVIYRWCGSRISDAAIERALERLAAALRRPFRGDARADPARRPADTPDRGD